MYGPPGYMLLAGIMFVVGLLVQSRLKSKFRYYSELPLDAGLSGKQVAERMLSENNIHDVRVISTPGFLSDHYNPENKTINLSPDVFDGRSISAAAVAAHETGHAVQHAVAYGPLQLRSKLVPITQISTTLSQWVLLAGVGILGLGRGNQTVLLIGILLFAISTVFSLITLPVEYDASNRALKWMEQSGLAKGREHEGAADALKWAARTYVVAAIASIATLLYYINLFMGRNRD
ncbi:MAG: zinc metallopeptidase [Sphingobacteriales bacterium]|nr:MAG: zinc metallopeptidase [Sphingobacteriales bacterium]